MQQSLSYRALSQLKSFASATVNGAALLHGNQQAVWSGWRVAADDAIDKHALYQKAVQSGPGDAHHLQKFHKQYIGEGVSMCTVSPRLVIKFCNLYRVSKSKTNITTAW